MRNLTQSEISILCSAGNRADDWQTLFVDDNFDINTIQNCRFGGRVEIEAGVTLLDSNISNYHICSGAKVISTTSLECRKESSFGNGVMVSTVNDNEGRAVAIHKDLTAQEAYISAMYRHRKDTVKLLTDHALSRAESLRSTMGKVGKNSTIVGAKFIRETNIGENVTIDGASLIQNATLLEGVKIGVDVKAVDFIAAQRARVDMGAIVESCFIGEDVILSNGFTAVGSLIFAGSHLENGEASSVFAGPYTVSHHKSSLLIAGVFSFFNAGSGTNQSNHLFKCGAVHQSVHRRGCKFASNGYVMSPAAEGEFSLILGRHSKHHDTSLMPFSYLIENSGVTTLLPGFGLRSYGTIRDIEKWQQRDKRAFCRDIISYEEYNPLLAGKAIKAVKILTTLKAESPDAEQYHYNNTTIKSGAASRGITLYNQYITASLGAMLSKGCGRAEHATKWVDLSGQYIDKTYLDNLLDNLTSVEELNSALKAFDAGYTDTAHAWAVAALADRLGKIPTAEDIDKAIADGKHAHEAMRRVTDADKLSDCSKAMAVGYGTDSDSEEEVMEDFRVVRNLS